MELLLSSVNSLLYLDIAEGEVEAMRENERLEFLKPSTFYLPKAQIQDLLD